MSCGRWQVKNIKINIIKQALKSLSYLTTLAEAQIPLLYFLVLCMFQAAPKEVRSVEVFGFINRLRSAIWLIGLPLWLFAVLDRGIAIFSDRVFSDAELAQILVASFMSLCWLCLKPKAIVEDAELDEIVCQTEEQREFLAALEAKRRDLRSQHIISQRYTLPFPHLCQIYHLLNLKHLEKVHSFSLGNLRVTKVSDVQSTDSGGMIRFQTILHTPINVLRIWRQPIVEVELTLKTSNTVELKIPVYGSKVMTVMFNVLPQGENEHVFFVDIYTDLKWFKPVLQAIMHFASCLTLFEDLPYLQKLAERNVDRFAKLERVSNHEMMWLFKRYVELYETGTEPYLSQASA